MCAICSVATNSAWELRRHVNTVHMQARSHVCDYCSRTFSQKSDLNRHVVQHFVSTPHQCEFCDKKYRWEKQLREHMKVHDKNHIETPYICHLCGSRYKRGSALSKHFSTEHKLTVPKGFSHFVYKKCSDGLFRLQTKRCFNKSFVDQNAEGNIEDDAVFIG